MLNKQNFHPYQHQMVDFIIKNKASFIIAEMGLGKTAPVLMATNHLQTHRHYKSALIVAPLRVVYNTWPNEIKKWDDCCDMSYVVAHGAHKKDISIDANIYLTTYDSLQFILDSKLHERCDFLILDESSMVKNHRTKRFKLLKKLRTPFQGDQKKIILLTGTPSPSGELTEFFTQGYILDGGVRFYKTFTIYRTTFYYQKYFKSFYFNLRPNARMEIKDRIKDITFTLKAKDHLNLPPIIYNNVSVQLPSKTMKQYNKLEKDFLLSLTDIESKGTVLASNAGVLTSKLRQISSGAIYYDVDADLSNEESHTISDVKHYDILHHEKIHALDEIVNATDDNILCAFQFKFEKAMIKTAFPASEFIDGSTSPGKGDLLIQRWTSGSIKLLCVHPASCAHGTNLQTGGHTIVWFSLDWSLERNLQLNARLHRQGQKNTVIIHKIIAASTIDEVILEVIKKKKYNQDTLINALLEYQKSKTKKGGTNDF